MYGKFGQALAAKLALLTAGEDAAVRPGIHPPSDVVPLVSWRRMKYDPVMVHDEFNGEQGVCRAATIGAEVVVWDTDSVRKDRVVDLVIGTADVPGLLGLREWMPSVDDAGRIGVQAVALDGDPFDDAEKAEDGTETWWYSTTINLTFTCVTE